MKASLSCALIIIIMSCSPSTKMESTEQPASTNDHTVQEMEMLHEGIDFVAFASDSSWSLKIDLEKDIIFKSDSIAVLSTPVPEPSKTAGGQTLRYTAAITDTELIVEIQTVLCKDDILGIESPYSVIVQVKKTSDRTTREFKGCGHYLIDLGLHDVWVLKELNGRAIKVNDYIRELPRIEINTTDGKILGNSGCNNFFGSLLTRGDKITFADIGATKMFCEKSVETEFFKMLSEAQRFEIKDLHLLLYKEDVLIAALLKVD